MSATRLRVLVVDDEPLARESLCILLARVPDVEVVGECGDGRSALEAVRTATPDVVLLDVRMPVLDGFEVAASLDPGRPPLVVFVTAYDEYAVRAFEALALDYLVKPCSEERLRQALDRVREHLSTEELSEVGRRVMMLAGHERRLGGALDEAGYLRRLAVTKADRTLVVDVGEIDWIEADDYYVRVHTGGAAHLLRRSLKWFEGRLDPAGFVRVHRSAIVNAERIKEIRKLGADDHVAVLGDGTRVPLSRSGRDALARWLDPSFREQGGSGKESILR